MRVYVQLHAVPVCHRLFDVPVCEHNFQRGSATATTRHHHHNTRTNHPPSSLRTENVGGGHPQAHTCRTDKIQSFFNSRATKVGPLLLARMVRVRRTHSEYNLKKLAACTNSSQ